MSTTTFRSRPTHNKSDVPEVIETLSVNAQSDESFKDETVFDFQNVADEWQDFPGVIADCKSISSGKLRALGHFKSRLGSLRKTGYVWACVSENNDCFVADTAKDIEIVAHDNFHGCEHVILEIGSSK